MKTKSVKSLKKKADKCSILCSWPRANKRKPTIERTTSATRKAYALKKPQGIGQIETKGSPPKRYEAPNGTGLIENWCWNVTAKDGERTQNTQVANLHYTRASGKGRGSLYSWLLVIRNVLNAGLMIGAHSKLTTLMAEVQSTYEALPQRISTMNMFLKIKRSSRFYAQIAIG